MLEDRYLNDEQITKLREQWAYTENPYEFCTEYVARKASDYTFKCIFDWLDKIENPFEGYIDVIENIRMAKSQGFERFRVDIHRALKEIS